MTSYTDLHLHSYFSDGSLSPEELASGAKDAGLSAAILTDHDNCGGTGRMIAACESLGIETLSGIELSCAYKKHIVHILGYGMDWTDAGFTSQVDAWRNERGGRNARIIAKLNAHGYEFSMDDLRGYFPNATLTRANIAVYMVDHKMIPDKDYAFGRLIGEGCPCYEPRKDVLPHDAVRFLREHGAVPVFAHPILAGFNEPELDALTGSLKEAGLMGMEGYYSMYSAADEALVAKTASKHRLFITGGSDFHGAAKPTIFIGTGKGNLRVPYECFENLLKAKAMIG